MGATIPLLSVWQPPPYDAGFAQALTIEGWEPEEEALVVAGLQVPDPLPNLLVSRRTAGPLPETMASTSAVRLVNDRIREALARALRDRVQFLSASLAGLAVTYCVPNPLELRPCAVASDGRLVAGTDDLPPLFRVQNLPSLWVVRGDLERRIRSATSGEFVPLHQFRLDARSRYRADAEDGWQ